MCRTVLGQSPFLLRGVRKKGTVPGVQLGVLTSWLAARPGEARESAALEAATEFVFLADFLDS